MLTWTDKQIKLFIDLMLAHKHLFLVSSARPAELVESAALLKDKMISVRSVHCNKFFLMPLKYSCCLKISIKHGFDFLNWNEALCGHSENTTKNIIFLSPLHLRGHKVAQF